MKKTLFLVLLGLPILFLGGCSLINNNDGGINSGYVEKISQLEEQLSGLLEQFSGLKAENENLQESLSGTANNLKILQTENEKLQANINKYKNIIFKDKLSSKNSTKSNQDNTENDTITYNNRQYGFSLELPNSRKGYIATTKGNTIEFGFSEQSSILIINAISHNEWNIMQKGLIHPTYLGENTNYVFVYDTAQDAINQTIINRMGEINNIIQTFKIN